MTLIDNIMRYSIELDQNSNCCSDDEDDFGYEFGISRTLPQHPLTNKTIILDMDLTLICTIGDGSDMSERMRTDHRAAYNALVHKGAIVPSSLVYFGGSGRAVHNDIVKRPGVDAFLTFCRYVFKHVILWSAGQANYVYDVVKYVLDPNGIGIFDHIYTAHDIVHRRTSTADNPLLSSLRASGYVSCSTKPIEKLTEKFPDVTLKSTIIIDDLPCNFLPNPKNGILIPPFSPQIEQMVANAGAEPLDNMSDDYCLFKLLHYLADNEFLSATDVRDCKLDFFGNDGECEREEL